MTRKDFTLLANALRDAREFDTTLDYTSLTMEDRALFLQWNSDIIAVANALASTNNRFDKDRFLQACREEK